MAELQEVRVPDIGAIDSVTVVEVLVKVGDTVELETPLVTLESDKASMEVPSPAAGVVKEIKVKAGDSVGQDAPILVLEAAGGAAAAPDQAQPTAQPAQPAPAQAQPVQPQAAQAPPADAAPPAEGAPPAEAPPAEAPPAEAAPPAQAQQPQPQQAQPAAPAEAPAPAPAAEPTGDKTSDDESFDQAYAGPGVRKLARELGVDLGQVAGNGRKGRITPDDLKLWVKEKLAAGPGAAAAKNGGGVSGFEWPQMPAIDFSKFGPVEKVPLSRIRRATALNLHRSWLHVPHVTQHEDADITELEAFRKAHAEEAQKRGVKLTPLALVMKAVAAALREFPNFNSSLDPSGESLIVKKYCHLGVAVDTPNGLVVPVVHDVDQKGLWAIAKELGEKSAAAREGKLGPKDYQGAGFTITSLGGIGGTAFTPIVNAPEVAILGVSRSSMKPVWQDGEFVPRLMLPLSLSYDHRVIDGASACRFIVHLAALLADLRKLLF
jgi:pyruvate dehydrogenase E2 component (dihydrolipoamide acetyltransferase)